MTVFAAPFQPLLRDGLVAVVAGGEAVVVDERTGRLHRFNATATAVLACIDGAATVDEIVDELATSFGADPSVVSSDVGALLAELRDAGLLEGLVSEGPVDETLPQPGGT
jgi:PqqD family protein of HPr-rel-A system